MAFAVIGHSFVRRLQDHPLLKLEGADVQYEQVVQQQTDFPDQQNFNT